MRSYFINLDRSGERRQHMERQAGKLPGGVIERFPAVDGGTLALPPSCALSPGGLGCFLSHYALIRAAPPGEPFLVFEDDVEVADDLAAIINDNHLASFADQDIVLLDCAFFASTDNARAFHDTLQRQLLRREDLADFRASRRIRGVEIYNVTHSYAWGASSYLVTARGRERVLATMQECLDRGPPGQWDILIRDACRDGRLRGAVLVPFLATPLLESIADTTIDDRCQSEAKLRLMSAIRRLFYAGPIDAVPSYVADLLYDPAKASTPLALLAQLSGRSLELFGEQLHL